MTRGEVHEVDEDLPISENSPTYSANLASDRRSSTAPTSIGLRERWRSVPTGWRSVIIVVLAVVLVGALIRLTSAVTEGNVPQGPQSSSFSPSPEGLEAYSQLLSASGVRVQQLTAPLSRAAFPSGATVVVAAPTSWQPSYSTGLVRFLDGGGRVVVAGEPPAGLLRALLGDASQPVWSANPLAESGASGTSPLVFGVAQVDSIGPGSWSSIGASQPLLSARGAYLAVSEQVGNGTLVLMASPAPLQNRLIGRADNAAFAIDIGMSPGKVVSFDEYDHGYGQVGGGLAGLPASWKVALLIASAAVIFWLLSAVRRFGPPEEPERTLAPPRVAYVDAIATLLSSAAPDRAASATTSLQTRAREGLCRRLGLPHGALDGEIASAARSAGVRVDLVTAVLSTPRTVDELVAVGRASSEISTERRQ